MGGVGQAVGSVLSPIGTIAHNVMSDIGGAVAGGAGRDALTKGPVGDVLNPVGYAARQLGGGDPQAPGAPATDPNLLRVQQQQNQLADDFSANKEGLKSNLYDNLAQGSRAKLASNLAGNNSNYSSRGLLYSGLKQGADAGANASAQSEMNQGRMNINNQVEDKANSLQARAAGVGLDQASTQGAISDQIYQQALAEQTATNQAYSGLGQGVGSVVGGYLGNRNANRPNTTTNYMNALADGSS